MIGMRFSLRLIGIVSTIILARLLVPEDFGLVAMATILYTLIEILGEFGFDIVLIQRQDAGRDFYDSAWTMTIIRGVVVALVLWAGAGTAARIFEEPRLVDIMHVLAFAAVAEGFVNIGVVDFRKNLTFGKDFNYMVGVKVVSFVVTIAAAFILRNYWALVIGIVSAAFAKLTLSYVMHPYRPRLSLAQWREILNFSKWLIACNILGYANLHSSSLVVAKLLGAASLGIYTVAYEIATLASTELVAPIRRALLPGYAKIEGDREALRRSFRDGFSLIVMLGFPIAAGLGLVADLLVRAVLGANWLDAIPLLQGLAFYGVLLIASSNIWPLFFALGKPNLTTMLTGLQCAVLLPGVAIGTWRWGLDGTIVALTCSAAVMMVASLVVAARTIEMPLSAYAAESWRSLTALGLMIAAVLSIPDMSRQMHVVLELLLNVAVGAAVYTGTQLIAWYLSGCPHGPERMILGQLARLRRQAVLSQP